MSTVLKGIIKKAIVSILIALSAVSFFVPQKMDAANNTVFKDSVGLNVHWALGGFLYNGRYEYNLNVSKTKWVREHFYTEVIMSGNQEAWLRRYDYVVDKYDKMGIKVVGMLAYGQSHGDFSQPDKKLWQDFVRLVVHRYRDKIKYWEIWNEPDSESYLTPNNYETYRSILHWGHDAVKQMDPNAKVIVGGISWPNAEFIDKLYKGSRKYFDNLAIHLYYCNPSLDTADMNGALDHLKGTLDKYGETRKVWVTEMGCSTDVPGVDEIKQKQWLAKAIPEVLNKGWIERVFIYNIRNRDTGNAYEDQFGLLDLDMKPRPAFWWYYSLPRGPYDRNRVYPLIEQAKALELKNALEKYFGKGQIPITRQNWPTVANSYIYGGYPVLAIRQAIRFGGKTVHPTIPWNLWKNTLIYKEYINKH